MKMKSVFLIFSFALFAFSLFAVPAGRGGGARGGGSRAAAPRTSPRASPRQQNRPVPRTPPRTPSRTQNINRSPSMSRPQVNVPRNVSNLPAQMPSRANIPQRPQQMVPPKPRPTFASQARARNETKQFIQERRAVQGNMPRKMQQPANFGSTLQNQMRTGVQASGRVGNNVRQRYPEANRWFNDRFFDSHRSYDFFGHRGANWWWGPSWGAVANWFPWGWQYPYYYYYPGYAEVDYAPYSDPYLQLQEQPLEAVQADNMGVVNTGEGAWMPLGVFAAGVDENDAAYTNFFIQLAVDKNGNLAGTFYNAATDETRPLAGSVDLKTQQAVWKVSDSPNSPVMMTGLYNLTQDLTEVEVCFTNEAQQWVLVRVKQ